MASNSRRTRGMPVRELGRLGDIEANLRGVLLQIEPLLKAARTVEAQYPLLSIKADIALALMTILTIKNNVERPDEST